MNSKKFSEAMNEIDEKYLDETITYKRKNKKTVWMKWGAIAACLCLVVAGGMIIGHYSKQSVPNPGQLQIPNPIISVTSIEEMEKRLDFKIPILDKNVENYSVLIEDGKPSIGQVDYMDGSEFRIRYGSGDISGIYGGALVESREIDGVKVDFFRFSDAEFDIAYAIWEQNDFTFSYIYLDENETELKTFIQQYK